MSFGQILALVPEALWESIYMTIGSTALAYVIGLPLGLVLVELRPGTAYTPCAR